MAENICWITLTHGRKEIFSNSRTSWYENLKGNIVKEIIIDDSGDLTYFDWLQATYKNAKVVKVGYKQMGFTEAMDKSFSEAVKSGCDFIFHLEEDFTLLTEVDLDVLVNLLKENSVLSQIILKRNPVFEHEIKAGDVLNSFETIGVETLNGIEITKQNVYWSTNPSLYPIQTARIGWVNAENSENRFSEKIFQRGFVSAYLGTSQDENICYHPIDEDSLKTGIGY